MNRHYSRRGGQTRAQSSPANGTVETTVGHDGKSVFLSTSAPIKTLYMTIEEAEDVSVAITQTVADLREHNANLTQAGQNVG